MITDLITPGALAVIALLVIPAVVGLVNMLKAVGLAPRWAGPVAVVIGLAIMLAYGIWGEHHLFVYALLGILIGLGAAGFYDLAKLLGRSPAAAVVIEHDAPVSIPASADAQQVAEALHGMPQLHRES